MSNTIAGALAALSFVTAVGVSLPQAPPPTGLIAGRVVDAGKDTGVAGAVVSLTGGSGPARRVLVDPQGRYFFDALPAGSYTIAATKTGFLPGAFGRRRADGAGYALDLRDAERVIDASIALWRSATISGTVTDDADDPVSGVSVQVLRRAIVAGHWRLVNSGRTGVADERGQYRVAGLAPGEYALVITSITSSMPMSFVQLADATRRMDGASSGELFRELQTKGSGGMASDASQGFAMTRVGDMLLQLSGGATTNPDDRSVNAYPTIWYPSAAVPAQATRVTVRAGDNLTGIDFRPVLTPTVRVSGVVSGPDGPIPYLALRLLPSALEEVGAEITSSLALSFTTAQTVSDASGAFTFMAVPPGQYIVRALTTPPPIRPPAPPSTMLQTADGMTTAVSGGPAPPPMVSQEPTWWTATPVSASDTDVSGVTVLMRPGVRVTGRVEFNGTATKPTAAELAAIKVMMDPADGRSMSLPTAYQAQIDANSRFYTIGLIAGRYLLRLDAPPRGWTLESAMIAGRDICDIPLALESKDVDGLVLTFTDRPSGLAGTVRDRQGAPDRNASVLIFPSDGVWMDLGASPRRLRSVRPSRTGAFAVPGLPAGDYFVAAVDDVVAGAWQDQTFLQRLAGAATRVAIAAGQGRNLDLVTSVVR